MDQRILVHGKQEVNDKQGAKFDTMGMKQNLTTQHPNACHNLIH